MFTVSISVPRDTATPAITRLTASLQPEAVLPVLARSVANTVRDNYDMLEATRPNKLGGERTHYYSHARQSTGYVVNDDEATVSVRQVGIRMRYYGGVVRAGVGVSAVTGQPTKFLTIPVTPESYGHRAADFPDLTVLWGRNGPYALARVTEGSIVKGSGGSNKEVEVLFALKAEVTIPADETMLPTNQAMAENMHSDFLKYVNLLWRRGGGAVNP